MSPTKEDIEKAVDELRLALFESIEIDEEDKQIKLKKQKSHYRLSKARDEVRNLKI